MKQCQEIKHYWTGRKNFVLEKNIIFLRNFLQLVPNLYLWKGDCVLGSASYYFL